MRSAYRGTSEMCSIMALINGKVSLRMGVESRSFTSRAVCRGILSQQSLVSLARPTTSNQLLAISTQLFTSGSFHSHFSSKERLDSVFSSQKRWLSSQKNPLGLDEEDVDQDDYKPDAAQKQHLRSSKETILFQRSESNLELPKYGFWVAVFNSSYWIWYAIDFFPAAKAAGYDVHWIAPVIGMLFGMTGQLVATMFPVRLISKISYVTNKDTKDIQLHVYPFSLPFVKPSTTPRIFPLGELNIMRGREAKIVDSLGIANYRGYIPLFPEKKELFHHIPFLHLPYLMDIRDDDCVKDPDLLRIAVTDTSTMAPSPTSESPKKKLASNRIGKKARVKSRTTRRGGR